MRKDGGGTSPSRLEIDSQALGEAMGYAVTAVDPDAGPDDFPEADQMLTAVAGHLAAGPHGSRFAVVATLGERDEALPLEPAYLGAPRLLPLHPRLGGPSARNLSWRRVELYRNAPKQAPIRSNQTASSIQAIRAAS